MRISVANRMVQRRKSSPSLLRFKIYVEIILELRVQQNYKAFNKLATNRSILFSVLVQYLANRIFIHIFSISLWKPRLYTKLISACRITGFSILNIETYVQTVG